MADDRNTVVKVSLGGHVVRVLTEKAIGIAVDEQTRDVAFWLPRSQVTEIMLPDGELVEADDLERGAEIEAVMIPQWLADKHGLGEDGDSGDEEFYDGEDVPF